MLFRIHLSVLGTFIDSFKFLLIFVPLKPVATVICMLILLFVVQSEIKVLSSMTLQVL